MRDVGPYPAYRSSDRDWLGNIPVHWPLTPLKRLCSFAGGGTPSKENSKYWIGGDIPWVSPKDMKAARISDSVDHVTAQAVAESSTAFIQPGALLMVVRSGILQRTIPVAINDVRVTLNQDMKALAFSKPSGAEYFSYLVQGHTTALRTRWLKEGATVESIEHPYLANDLIPDVPSDEIEKIVSFLDYETAKIDRLIEKQERLIALLKEKRQAVISHAVTKGLDPTAPLRDSGVEWLGQVPAHWEECPLKALFSLKHGYAFDGAAFSDSGTFILMTPGNFHEHGGFRPKVPEKYYSRSDFPSEFILRQGQLLVAMTEQAPGLLGCALLVPETGTYLHNQRLGLVRSVAPEKIDDRYLFHLFNSPRYRAEVSITATGAKVRHTSPSKMLSIKVWLPPLDEQIAIATFVDSRISTLESLQDKAEQTITLLAERRTALISAAVTGKIDVRGWKPPEGSEDRVAPERAEDVA